MSRWIACCIVAALGVFSIFESMTTEDSKVESGSPGEYLLAGASAYAAHNFEKLCTAESIAIADVTVIEQGSGFGQSLAPTPDQLVALGYLPSHKEGGSVVIKKVDKAGSCQLEVATIYAGKVLSQPLIGPAH